MDMIKYFISSYVSSPRTYIKAGRCYVGTFFLNGKEERRNNSSS